MDISGYVKKAGRVLWSDRILLPLSWVALVFGGFSIVISVIFSKYDVLFWTAVGITLWSAYDVIKYKRRIRHLPHTVSED